MQNEQFLTLIDILRDASDILVFTGATASGIPDYRGPQGVWTRRTPVYYQDFMRSEAARIEYWDYKLEAWEAFRDAQPNPVHHAIVKLERASKLCKLNITPSKNDGTTVYKFVVKDVPRGRLLVDQRL